VLHGHETDWKRALRASPHGSGQPARDARCRVFAMLLAPDGGILWQASGSRGDSLPSSLEQTLLDNDF